jgi:uncharacterized protein
MLKMESTDQGIDFANLWRIVTGQFPLGEDSDHGPDHWKRVEANGLLLANATGADIMVVRLFALFHDSRRENEFTDPDHGRRGAAYASTLRSQHFEITDSQFDLLQTACIFHTEAKHHTDPSIGTCWDADRLDLGRVGIYPDPEYMNTPMGRHLANHATHERMGNLPNAPLSASCRSITLPFLPSSLAQCEPQIPS